VVELSIGILFATIGIGIHFAVKDAFKRDKNGRLNLAKNGYGTMLSLSAFSYGHDESRKQLHASLIKQAKQEFESGQFRPL